jgi:hypothetical protein
MPNAVARVSKSQLICRIVIAMDIRRWTLTSTAFITYSYLQFIVTIVDKYIEQCIAGDTIC